MPKTKNKYSLLIIEILSSILLLSLTLINLNTHTKNKNVLGVQTEVTNQVIQKIVFLEDLIKNNPHYFDAYVQLINLNRREHNFEKAKEYVEMAKKINPNSLTLRKIQKDLD